MKKISICILFSTRFSIISYGFQYLSLFESSIHTSRGVTSIISLGDVRDFCPAEVDFPLRQIHP